MRIAFIGVGIMGGPIARHLLAGGHRVAVHDVNPEAAASLKKAGATSAPNASAAVEGAAVVFTSLPTPSIVRDVALGSDGFYDTLDGGGIHVDLSTIDPETAEELDREAQERGLRFLNAPVSGGPARAEEGSLSVMASGAPEIFEEIRPLLLLFARPERLFYCGRNGASAIVKLANNLVEIGTNLLLAEAFGLAVAGGVDSRVVFEVMRQSSANCRLLEDWGESILQGDFDPAKNATLDIIAKDIRLATDLGRAQGVPMEVSNLVDQFLTEARRRGWGQESMTAVGRLQEERVGGAFRFAE